MKKFSVVSRRPSFIEQLFLLLPYLFSAFNDQKHFQWSKEHFCYLNKISQAATDGIL